MKKIICVLLCALMLIPVLVACGNGESKQTTDTGTTPPTPNTSETESIYTPSGNRYDGSDFNVLVSCIAGDIINFFTFAEENPTVIDLAVQKKNEAVAQDYGVVFNSIKDAGKNNTGSSKMQQSIDSESLDFHLSYISSYDVIPLATQNSLYELNSLPGLNLKNEWWDQNANKDLSVNGLLYFTTGDIDAWDDMQQFIMIFNRSLFERDIKDYTVDEFYKLSSDGKWTYDEFYKIAKGYTKDLDGNQNLDSNDQWGMITWADTIYAVFASSDAKIVSNDDNGLTLSMFGDQVSQNCMREYTEWTNANAYNYTVRDNYSGSNAIKMFSNDRALFFLARLQSLNNFRDMDSDFGLVPVPKYTEEQEYAVMSSPYHLSLICTLNLDVDTNMRGDVIESLAYYSKQHLTPAYREKTLEGQSARDDGSLDTLEISAGNRIYDIGFFIKPGNVTPKLNNLYKEGKTDYASLYAEVKDSAEMAVSEVAAAYKALAGN